MDRTPLSEATDKEAPKKEADTGNSSGLSGKDITEMRDMKSLSLLYGFDGDGFEGQMNKVMPVYDWVRNALDSDGGPETILLIKSIINNEIGSDIKGKVLAEKVYQWFSFEESVKELEKEIEGLRDRQKILT